MFNACVIWAILVTELIFLSGKIAASLTLKLKYEKCLKVVWKNPSFNNLINLCPKWRKKPRPGLMNVFRSQHYSVQFANLCSALLMFQGQRGCSESVSYWHQRPKRKYHRQFNILLIKKCMPTAALATLQSLLLQCLKSN